MFSKILSTNCFFKVEFWTRTSISEGFTPAEISSVYFSTNTLHTPYGLFYHKHGSNLLPNKKIFNTING